MTVLIVVSLALTLAWLPLAVRFNRGWKTRKNPVSLAICAAALLFAYTNAMFALVLMGQATWQFFTIATHALDALVITNFYISFHWSDKKFEGARQGDSVAPPNTTSTRRRS